jgi:hypothetical protein
MSTHVFTTMTTAISDSAVFDEAVVALSELSKNTEEEREVIISTDAFSHDEENQEIIDILNRLKSSSATLSGQKRTIDQVVEAPRPKVRKPPISIKCCNVCNNTFHVSAPQKKCMDTTCNGKLEIKAKEPNVLKRNPPKCSKFCNVCDKMSENIPTACKKCSDCGNLLKKVDNKEYSSKIEVVLPVPKYATSGEFEFSLDRC